MTSRVGRFCPTLLASLLLPAVTAWAQEAQKIGADRRSRPNILFVLTDDQGWSTLGCYGSRRAPTVHLDRLAADGMRFTQAYVYPQCTPTRAALFSGQHSARTGMWHVIPWYGLPWARVAEPAFREQFPRDWPSLPKLLRAAGYVTGMAGKWHLTTGADGDYVALKPSAADAFGFDFVAPKGPGTQNEGDKWVDHLTDHAIGFMRQHRDRPWFFYLAHHTLHGVVSAPPALIAKHRGAGAPESGRHNATYLAAIEHLDLSIGRLLATLDELRQRDNTLVVFLSDNGGVDASYSLPDRRQQLADGAEPLRVRSEEFDNAPLRAGKGSPYEGGIRVPCLVRWPTGIKAGSVCETPIHVVDWLPTLLAAADVRPPSDHRSDGVTLLPLFHGAAIADRPLFWHLPLYDLRWAATPCAVVRHGDWKLIEYFGDRFDASVRYRVGRYFELYNLRDDVGETRDLATAHPQRVRDLQAQLHAWLASIPAPIPGPNPHFDPTRQFEETRVRFTTTGANPFP